MFVSTMPRSANAGIATQRSTPAYMRCTQRMRGPASITSATHSPITASASAASRAAAARSGAATSVTPGAASCIQATRAASAPISTTFLRRRPARAVAERNGRLAQPQFLDETGACGILVGRPRGQRRQQAQAAGG